MLVCGQSTSIVVDEVVVPEVAPGAPVGPRDRAADAVLPPSSAEAPPRAIDALYPCGRAVWREDGRDGRIVVH